MICTSADAAARCGTLSFQMIYYMINCLSRLIIYCTSQCTYNRKKKLRLHSQLVTGSRQKKETNVDLFFILRVKSQLKRLARPMYSNPPVHGARIVANVVGDSALFGEWKAEMELMAGRIKNVRQKLYDSLMAKDKSGKEWSFILKQIGMFSFTGLNKAQVLPSSHDSTWTETCFSVFDDNNHITICFVPFCNLNRARTWPTSGIYTWQRMEEYLWPGYLWQSANILPTQLLIRTTMWVKLSPPIWDDQNRNIGHQYSSAESVVPLGIVRINGGILKISVSLALICWTYQARILKLFVPQVELSNGCLYLIVFISSEIGWLTSQTFFFTSRTSVLTVWLLSLYRWKAPEICKIGEAML